MAATTRVNILGITMAVWTAAAIASTPSPILEFASRFHLKNITSPNYPSHYLGKTNCSWVIQSDYSNGAGYVIKVVFNEFSLYENDFFNEFSSLLECLAITSSKLLITGDFNFHVNKPSETHAKKFLRMLKGFNLKPHVNEATHKNGNTLDLLITRSGDNFISDVRIVPGLISPTLFDHYAIHSQVKLNKPSFERKEITYRKLRAVSIEALQTDIKSSTLLSDYSDMDLMSLVGNFEIILANLLDTHAPIKKRTITLRPYAPWYNDSIDAEKRKRRNLERRWQGICSSPFSDSKVHRLHGSSGTFFSPFHYPRPYPRTNGSWSCTWVLSVSPGNMVNVKFEHLELPFRSNDSVEVRDGQSAHDKMIKTYTKHGSYFEKSDVVLYSTGRYMWVRFNFSFDGRTGYQDRGFRAHFKATPRFLKTTCLPGNILNPYLELTGNHGTLKSPMKYYPPNLYCRWLITVPEGKVVELTFVRIEIAFDCSFRCYSYICHDSEDFVSVQWRGRNHTTVRKKYCGRLQKEAIDEDNRLPDPILSPYSNLTVIFKSEVRSPSTKYTGFEATFKAVDKNSNGGSEKAVTIGVSVGVSVSVSVVVLIALVVSVVWFVRRRKARALSTAERDANVQMTRINEGNTSPGTTRVTRVNASNTSPAPTRAVTTASHDTQTSPPPPQVAGQQSESRSPPPSLNSVPVQTIPSGPPPEYPYPLDSPPPYPGVEKALQYPPPGQSYPWLQSMPEPSAPPASPRGDVS